MQFVIGRGGMGGITDGKEGKENQWKSITVRRLSSLLLCLDVHFESQGACCDGWSCSR